MFPSDVSNSFLLGVALLGVAVFFAIGATFFESTRVNEAQVARTYWDNNKPDSYSYSVKRSCFCFGKSIVPYTVHVSIDDTYAEIDDSTRSKFGPIDITGDEILSVDRVFDLVEEALRDADRVSVSYDWRYRYPKFLYIDWRSDITDDEYRLWIEEFTPSDSAD